MTNKVGYELVRLMILSLGLAGCGDGTGSAPPPPLVWPSDGREGEVAGAVRAFYDAFNAHSFDDSDFMTDDWNFITPGGEWFDGKDDALDALAELHETTLADVTLTARDLAINFVAADVAVAVVTAKAKSPTIGNDVVRSTFILVARDGLWSVAQTQATFLSEVTPAIDGSETQGASELGGEAMSVDERSAGVRKTVAWFHTLQISHDFEDYDDYTSEDLNTIAPTGRWFRGRDAAAKEGREVGTTFLDGVVITVEETSMRFLTDDVALVTELTALSRFTDPNGVDRRHVKIVASSLLANHGGHWLLEHTHATGVESSL